MGGDIDQHLVSLPVIKFGNSSQKTRTNRYQTFLVLPDQVFWFSLFCSRYFVQDCSSYETLSWLFRSLLWCKKKVATGMENRHITHCILHIPYTNTKISIIGLIYICPHFFWWHRLKIRNLPTSILVLASVVSFLTFNTSTIFAPLWFTNFQPYRF